MSRPIVTVFGGSGFIGRHVVTQLAGEGYLVRAVVRDVHAANFLRPMGHIGQVIPWPGNITDPASVSAAVDGAQMVVNTVGILSQWGRQTFQRIHVEGAANVAKACSDHGIKRLIHMSANGAVKTSESDYARTKAEGEDAVLAAFPNATIMRPSVVFGQEDSFFNKFAALSRITPVLPVIGAPFIPEFKLGGEHGIEINIYGDGGPKLQPVFVGDVSHAILNAMNDNSTCGKSFELGGPVAYSFKELMELMLAVTGKKRFLYPLAYPFAKIKAFFLGMLPNPILTTDQVTLLKSDNVMTGDLPGLNDLGIQPQAAEAILPTYLYRYRAPGYEQIKNS
ncbi:MAG: complex I NDUFA9 subunit family protein [Rhodospirillales bacterium]|jgi:uncharacterized protein YbjT (DUF2867 family)|nr:complex I NDUFA9 subunit family protein [Rhodospirillales bacterium]